jgi:hypothetical protein
MGRGWSGWLGGRGRGRTFQRKRQRVDDGRFRPKADVRTTIPPQAGLSASAGGLSEIANVYSDKMHHHLSAGSRVKTPYIRHTFGEEVAKKLRSRRGRLTVSRPCKLRRTSFWPKEDLRRFFQ